MQPLRSKNGSTKQVIRKVDDTQSFRSVQSKQANGKHVNGTIAFPHEHKTKLVRNRSAPVLTAYLSVPETGTKMERNDCVPM